MRDILYGTDNTGGGFLVTWDKPVSDGGSPITGFSILSSKNPPASGNADYIVTKEGRIAGIDIASYEARLYGRSPGSSESIKVAFKTFAQDGDKVLTNTNPQGALTLLQPKSGASTSVSIDPSQGFAISFWIKPENTVHTGSVWNAITLCSGSDQSVTSCSVDQEQFRLDVRYDGRVEATLDGSVRIISDNTYTTLLGNANEENVWTHFAFSLDEASNDREAAFYVDGREERLFVGDTDTPAFTAKYLFSQLLGNQIYFHP